MDSNNNIIYLYNMNAEVLNDLIKNTKTLTIYDKKLLIEKLKEYYPTIKENFNINSKNLTNLIDTRDKNNKNNVRKLLQFKQRIYLLEIEEIIKYIKDNLDTFTDFTSILLYVAKRRKIIEILKLNPDYMLFGTFRKDKEKERLFSFIKTSRGNHLINELQTEKNRTTNIREHKNLNNHAFTYNGIQLTSRNSVVGFTSNLLRNYAKWIHTKSDNIIKLLEKIETLYDDFKIKISKEKLSELYWLYIQACPFSRGSASIGEIIFSALLQKFFGCNFKLFEEQITPQIIPDIHALSYNLDKFKSLFWQRFTTCKLN